MSLFSILNSEATSSYAASSGSTLLQQISAQQDTSLVTNSSTTGSTNLQSVLITIEAKRAAAESQDAGKDGAALAAEIGAALDSQKEAGNKTADLHAFSARALSIIALNADGRFGKADVTLAKAQLRERDRSEALAVLNSGELTSETLMTYSAARLSAQSTMSAEERQFRAVHPDLR